MLRESLGKIVEGQNLDVKAMIEAVGAIMEGQATGAQIGAFLTALRLKGESEEEIAGAAMALRDRCVRLPGLDNDMGNDLIDTCGTGGDGAGTVNVSTLAAITAAGAGVRVAESRRVADHRRGGLHHRDGGAHRSPLRDAGALFAVGRLPEKPKALKYSLLLDHSASR